MAAGNNERDLARGIYVKGVNESCTEGDIQDAFAGFGAITEVYSQLDRGFAFVTFADAAAVSAVLGNAPAEIAGLAITIEARKPRVQAPAEASPNIYVNELTEGTTREQVEAALSPFGTVVSIQMHDDRGFCYAAFETEEGAGAAVAGAPLQINGVAAGVEQRRSRAPKKRAPRAPREERAADEPTTSVYVKGLPEDYDEGSLQAWGAAYGSVVNVEWPEGADYAFVEFDSLESAAKALEAPTVGFIVEPRKSGRNKSGGRRRNRRRRNRRDGA